MWCCASSLQRDEGLNCACHVPATPGTKWVRLVPQRQWSSLRTPAFTSFELSDAFIPIFNVSWLFRMAEFDLQGFNWDQCDTPSTYLIA